MTTVTHQDIRVLGYCNRGARAFFAAHGLNWSSFMEQGVDGAVLLETGDEMAVAAVQEAARREGESK